MQIEVLPDDSDVSRVDDFATIESTDIDLSEDLAVRDDFDIKEYPGVAMPKTYEEYSLLSVEKRWGS